MTAKNKFRKEEEKIEGPTETFNPKKKGKKRTWNRNSKRGQGFVDSRTADGSTQPHYRGTNDLRWYVSDDRLLSDVARLSFANPAGSNIPGLLASNIYGNTTDDLTERLPGIMTIECIPTYGISENSSSPLNQGAQLLYNLIRAENSGARNYDAPDLMHYIMGVDNLFIYYANMLRVYGTMNNFTFLNTYTPKALVRAMGYNYDSIASNFSQFRSYINTFAKRLSTYILPHNITIVERHFSMFGRVYKDSESPKSQYYMYVPKVLWRYNAIGSTTGAAMVPITMVPAGVLSSASAGYTYDDIVRVGDLLLDSMNDEDMLTMAGDMLKAFGEGNIWKQDYINYDFTLDPIFDFTWLTQIQNLNSLDYFDNEGNMGDDIADFPYYIHQVIPNNAGNPWLLASCSLEKQMPILAHSKILVSPFDSPTPGDVMESTRLTLSAEVLEGPDSGWSVKITSCGAEIVSSLHLFTWINAITGVDLRRFPLFLNNFYAEGTNVNASQAYRDFAFFDAFAMHPTKYNITYNDATKLAGYKMELPMCDIDNWAVLPDSTIEGLHKVALLSMLYVRNAGFLAKY